jgi:hypothetical protein
MVSVSGSGAIECDGGTYGTLVGYDSAGVEAGRVDLTLIDPSDCSPSSNPDNVTFGAQGTLLTDRRIVQAVIFPMTPLEFTVLGECCGHASATYTVNVGRGNLASHIAVTCSPSTIERASSTSVSCTASASGSLAITGWTFTPTDPAIGSVTSSQTSATWAGMAVTSGAVTVQGTVAGVTAISDTGRIGVTPRTSGWSWRNNWSTGNATAGTFECNTQPHYVIPTPPASNDFGWVTSDSACDRGMYLSPNVTGTKPGFALKAVPSGGPNSGLWYVASDATGSHPRAQVLKDLRPDGSKYQINGSGPVAQGCKAANIKGQATVTEVNISCMGNPSPFGFSDLYAFAWRHEQCHESLVIQTFQSIPDARTAAETVVRSDSINERLEVIFHPNSFYTANDTLFKATASIDTINPQHYTFWSRNTANSAWISRDYQPKGILAPGC